MNYFLATDALYIFVTRRGLSMTLAIDTETFLDLDNHKGLVGIEILNPKRTWPIEAISQYLTSKQEGTLLAWNELAMEGGL